MILKGLLMESYQALQIRSFILKRIIKKYLK